jgi:CheY-like chemotaxis protein
VAAPGHAPAHRWAGLDDREQIQPGDRVVLIIEAVDDQARVLLDAAREIGWRAVVAADAAHGIGLVRRVAPSAIFLDLDLPDTDGWVLLDQLKHDAAVRHVPVHILSAAGHERRALRFGAFGCLPRPVAAEAAREALERVASFLGQEVREALVVEEDAEERERLADLLRADDARCTMVSTIDEAFAELIDGRFRCIVVDLGLRDGGAFKLLEQLRSRPRLRDLPVITYAPQLSDESRQRLQGFGDGLLLKPVSSPERLLEEVTLYLHEAEADLPEAQRRCLQTHQRRSALAGTTVLVVDDDVRNIFAVTSVLERHEATVLYAEGGKEALALLDRAPGIDVVLMDIMMPELDGYEVMRRIRAQARHASLPIIALTAKAMKADREKSIQAGASGYIAKPVDVQKLVSMIRVATARAGRLG